MNISDYGIKAALLAIITGALLITGAFIATSVTTKNNGDVTMSSNAVQATIENPSDFGLTASSAGSEPATPANPEQEATAEADTSFEEYAEAAAESDTGEVVTVAAKPETLVKASPTVNELAYKDNITTEEIISFKDYFESLAEIDETGINNFFKEYGYMFDFYQDEKGNYLFLVNEESLMQNDIVRPRKAIEAGLTKDQMDDAVAFPYELVDEQTGKVVKLKVGQKADFSEKELDDITIQKFQYLFGSPWGLEGDWKLFIEQKVASEFQVKDYYHAANDFIERCNKARTEVDRNNDGVKDGFDIWLTKLVSKDDPNKYYYFTTMDYLKYPISWFYCLYGKEKEIARYTVKAGDHYCLDICDFNSMRMLTPAKDSEDKPAIWYIFRTKMGKIALRFGSNLLDKRPMVYNYTAVSKPKPKAKVTPTPTPILTWTQNLILPTVPTPTTPTPGTPGDPPGPTPTPTPTPGPTPEPTPTPEIKKPSEGTKAPVGGGQNDDPGPGEKKDDQGNGDGEYKPGTSPNPGNTDEHPSGPPASPGGTDNGSTPPTSPINGGDPVNPAPKPDDGGGAMPVEPPAVD